MTRPSQLLYSLLLLQQLDTGLAFSRPASWLQQEQHNNLPEQIHRYDVLLASRSRRGGESNQRLSATTNSISDDTTSGTLVYESIFNFTNVQEDAVSKFERIDDAIMGGISLSSIRQQEGEEFARWSGVCRTDGGGFCGTRSMPFAEPLKVGANAEGLYLRCRFTSDDEPNRRVWKMTTRTENSRGEQLYQAMFEIPKDNDDKAGTDNSDETSWKLITIPFGSFFQVRGPRLVEGAPTLNVTGGLFQIGVTLSKFRIGSSTTELPNFRAGYFELQLKEIGVYSRESSVGTTVSESPLLETQSVKTLSLEEAKQKRPALLKILSPVTNLLFSEKARRRQSANRILRKRGMSRWQIFKYAFINRVERKGLAGAIFETSKVLLTDLFRFLLGLTVRVFVFFPFILMLRTVRLISGFLKPKRPQERS